MSQANDTEPKGAPTTLDEALAESSKYGYTPSPDVMAAAYAAMEQHRAIIQPEVETTLKNWKDWRGYITLFTRWYPKFLSALMMVGDVMITLTQTALIAFGVPLILIMLLFVEQQRVQHGVQLFEVNTGLAVLSAASLVMLNLILELLIHWIQHQAKWVEPPKHQFSLRLLYVQWLYIVGKSTDWQPAPKSPAIRFRVVLRLVTFSILALALAGSMESVINQTQGSWYDAIGHIFTQSTLLQAATWIGGFLFAFAAVLSAQALSQYVAVKVVQVVAIMTSQAEDKPRAVMEAIGIVGASVIMAHFRQFMREQRKASRAMTAAQSFNPVQSDVFGRIELNNSLKAGENEQKSVQNPFNDSNRLLMLRDLTNDEIKEIEGLAKKKKKLYRTINSLLAEPNIQTMSFSEATERIDVSSGTLSAARAYIAVLRASRVTSPNEDSGNAEV